MEGVNSKRPLILTVTSVSNYFIHRVSDSRLGVSTQAARWCSGRDLNPHAFRHTPLKRTCLPFHHPSGFWKLEDGKWEIESRKRFCRAKVLSFRFLSSLGLRRCEQNSGFQIWCSTFGSFVPFTIVLSQFFFRHGIIEPCLERGMS